MCNIPKNYQHCNIFFNTDIVSNLNIFITDINIYRIVNILSNILVIYNFWCVIVQSR